jgi:monolysocardiolipin acyltransferase
MAQMSSGERAALARWKPGRRWYHPAMAWLVIRTSRFVMTRLNRLTIEGREHLASAREAGRGLLTYSNHVSIFDDPLLVSCVVTGSYDSVRWVGADAINFFGSRPKSWLFTAGKSVPIVRGVGWDQPGMRFLAARLAAGGWVHLFPEGGRTRDPDGRMADEFKPGIGWLVAETRPLALPFYHYGMHRVLPVGSSRPRRGKPVTLRFGEPLDCGAGYLARLRGTDETNGPGLWRAIASDLHTRLTRLERAVRDSSGSQAR